MSDQPKAPTPVRRIVRRREMRRTEPSPAPVAETTRTPADLLAEAVNTASAAVPPQTRPAAGPAKSQPAAAIFPVAASKLPPKFLRQAGYGLGLVAAVGLGWTGATALTSAGAHSTSAPATAMPLMNWKAPLAIGQSQVDTRRLADDMKALRDSVAGLRNGLSRPKANDDMRDLAERVAALGQGVERLSQDTAAKLAQVATQLERADRAERDPAAKLAQIAERLDRIERQTAAAVTGSVPVQTAAVVPAASPKPAVEEKPEPKPEPKLLQGWVLRDIYDGLGLIEGRRGMFEVAPGRTYAGIGRIEKFERRGKGWVVITDKGYIAMN